MASVRSYLIPRADLDLASRAALRINVDAKLEEAARKLAIRPSIDDLVIRDTLPTTDLGMAAGESWIDPIAGVAAVEHVYFTVVVAQDRVIGFWGVGVETATAGIDQVRFQVAAGSVRGHFQIEQLQSSLEPVGYFSEAVIFTRQETLNCRVLPRLAYLAATERLHMFARTIEPLDAIVSRPSV